MAVRAHCLIIYNESYYYLTGLMSGFGKRLRGCSEPLGAVNDPVKRDSAADLVMCSPPLHSSRSILYPLRFSFLCSPKIIGSKLSHHSHPDQLTLACECLLSSRRSRRALLKYHLWGSALGIWALSWLKVRRLRHITSVLFFKKPLGRCKLRYSHKTSQCSMSGMFMTSVSPSQIFLKLNELGLLEAAVTLSRH